MLSQRLSSTMLLFLIFCLVPASAQLQVNGWSVPISPSGTYLTKVVPNIDGVTIPLAWNTVDTTGTCGSVPCTPTFDFSTNFDTPDLAPFWASSTTTCGATLRGTASPCNTNLVFQHITDGGLNSATPTYVFSQNWADTAALNYEWTASTEYAMGFTIIASPPNGHYYQQQGSGANGICTSAGSVPSMWNTHGGATPDNDCSWQDTGAHAPPQDVVTCTKYAGGPTAPGPTTMTGKVGNITTTNCGLGHISRCVEGDLATALPAIWETPYAYAMTLFNQYGEKHYTSAIYGSKVSQIKYIRIGVSMGGEASTACSSALESIPSLITTDAQLKGVWTSFAATTYLNNALTRASITPAPPSWYLLGSLNCGTGLSSGEDCGWADLEAQAILATDAVYGPVYGYGTQGLANGASASGLISDLINIRNGANCSGSTCCSNNWCEVRYYTIGQVPIIQLQECNISTPAGGMSGCLDNQDIPYNPAATLAQVFTLATQHGTNVMEIYNEELQCAFNNVATNQCPGSGVSSGYQAAILNLAIGLPNATTQIQGAVQIQGSASIQ